MARLIERYLSLLAGTGVLLVSAFIMMALLHTTANSNATGRAAAQALPDSGVSHPVTAVLLNFRAFDTLLEIAVLLLTLIAVWALDLRLPKVEALPASSVFTTLLRISVPLLVLISGYLLWVGASAPGGAFQAGALLAGGCLLLRLAGILDPSALALRWAVTVGLLCFLATAVATLGLTGGLLQFPVASAGAWILLIEAAATVSIAAILTALFIAREPGSGEPRG